MKDNLQLGFSTGSLYKNLKTRKEAISVIRNSGCKVIELILGEYKDFSNNQLKLPKKTDLEEFKYVSFHAPDFNYGNNKETRKIFKIISKFHKKIKKLDLVIFHPYLVKDFSVFDNLDFNVGFENMDNNKESCKSVIDMATILSKNNKFKFVLDMNHVYTNDFSMQLAKDFYQKLGSKIAEIHLSGFKTCHDPLFKTKQLEIIRAVRKLNIPIIIESTLTRETMGVEMNYILRNLKNNYN